MILITKRIEGKDIITEPKEKEFLSSFSFLVTSYTKKNSNFTTLYINFVNLIVVFLLTVGIVFNLIIIWLLIKSKKVLPQKILLLFFTLILFYLIHVYAEIHKIRALYIATFIFNNILEILVGPLLLVYIKSIFQDKKLLIKDNYYHFIPVTLYLVLVSIPFFISILKRKAIFNYLETINNYHEEISIIMMLYLIVYSFCSFGLFNKYKKAMKSNFSTIIENDFRWIKLMLVGILSISCFDLFTGLYEIYIEPASFETKHITVTLVIGLLIYLGYYGVKQSTILLPAFLVNTITKSSEQNKVNNRLSNLNREKLAQLKQSLDDAMTKEKLYLDEDLTLSKLATALSITDKNLSVLLNQYSNTTFYDFVNSYRVASVIEKLKSSKHNNITLLGIAYESGFKSKTSFNRIFKKETGLSPSAYKLSLQKKP